MYECIRVKVRSSTLSDLMINEEGDLDNESEDSDFEREMLSNKTLKGLNRQSGSSVGSMLSLI